mgnify:CR=1 FL=1
MEFENNKNDAWQLLSNVFHVGDGTREAPMKCIGNGIEIPMTPDEVQKGTEDIKNTYLILIIRWHINAWKIKIY